MPLILLPIMGFVVILIGAGWLHALRIQERAARTPPEPSCGNCGYNVIGLPGHICPECGSDLRQVGVLSGNYSIKLAYKGLFMGLGWTFVVGLLAYASAIVIFNSVQWIEAWVPPAFACFWVPLWATGALWLRKRYERAQPEASRYFGFSARKRSHHRA